MKETMKTRHNRGSLARLSAVLLMITLLVSMLIFAQAEQLNATPTPGLGLNTPTPTPKPTRTPKPTKTPKPTPTEYPFFPGDLDAHEGHVIEYQILDSNEWRHTIKEYCRTCQRTIKKYTEDHQLDADGRCLKCSYRCKHDRTLRYNVPADGAVKTWDGKWISYPGTEIEECYRCGKVLKSENKIIQEPHTLHLNTTTPAWIPNDENNHYADVTCLDCGTAFRASHAHVFNYDLPFEDDGDPETHTHMIVCEDCGYSAERREAHHFVHDSYMKDESDGTDTGHIEVLKCDVCGALKYEKQQHDDVKLISYKIFANREIHSELLECGLCKERYYVDRPHELVFSYCRHNGDTKTHIEVQVCIKCMQRVETRVEHKPLHVIWKSISDTQDQETVHCNLCGLTYTLAPVAHQFDSFSYESNETGNHTVYRACSKCGAREKNGKTYTEAHDFSGSVFCNKCGQSSYHEGSHSANYRIIIGYAQHDDKEHLAVFECGIGKCRAKFVRNHSYSHTFDPITMKCTECGFLKEGCEHRYRQVELYTKDGHYIGGRCVKCGKQISEPYFEKHTMQSAGKYCLQHSETGHTTAEIQKCSACGYQIIKHTGETAHKFVQDGNNQRCKECGYLKSSGCEHSFECTPDPKKQTATTHYCQLKCTKCGVETYKYEEHDLKLLSDPSWQQVNDKMHSRTAHYQCSVCGYEITATERELHENNAFTRYRVYDYSPGFPYHHKITGIECQKCGWHIVQDVKKEEHHYDNNICVDCRFPRKK